MALVLQSNYEKLNLTEDWFYISTVSRDPFCSMEMELSYSTFIHAYLHMSVRKKLSTVHVSQQKHV